MNVPETIASAISSGLTTLTELQTTLSIEDLHNILEIAAVDAHNRRIIEGKG